MTSFTIDIRQDGHVASINTEDGPMPVWVPDYTIMAQSPLGEVWALTGGDNLAEVQEVLATLTHDPASRPDLWLPCEPVYGSEAWDDAAEQSLAAFEADCYGEPRPRWW
jgi:hypothetical protein